MRTFFQDLRAYPPAVVLCAVLTVRMVFAAVPMLCNGLAEAAVLDVCMACVLTVLMVRTAARSPRRASGSGAKVSAWGLIVLVNVLIFGFSGTGLHGMSAGISSGLLFSGLVLYFCGPSVFGAALAPSFWCFVFMPYHETIMLLASYPLRLNATVLSGGVLRLLNVDVIRQGSSLRLWDLDLAITDACSGVSQLDAFFLLAVLLVQRLHRSRGIKALHLGFVLPSIVLANSVRIVLTVLLVPVVGKEILSGAWHIGLGYGQLGLAMSLFYLSGIWIREDEQSAEAGS